ncbi:hypothetical protein [Xanthobacter sediminis]
MAKLTKIQRIMLHLASEFEGGARVFPDQRAAAAALIAKGLAIGGGSLLSPTIMATEAGRAALTEQEPIDE